MSKEKINTEKDIKEEINIEESTDKTSTDTEQKSEKDIDSKSNKTSKKKSKKKKKNKEQELEEELIEAKEKIAEINDKYLRLYSEFDNFRKRTIKEKSDIYKTAGEDVIINIISVVDDFERAIKATEATEENKAHREGLELIYNRFLNILNQKNVKEIECIGKEFDTDLHEALTKIPAPTEDMKGKVIDAIEKGYTMNDKVIRFAKVVVGD
ncbi:MAG: nucleotide exchange factor GrpE [Bacteroidetes bacterium]|nr:MAG: nucleotide exchange factor GrpE [Bacteroidota bacterium]